MGGPNTLPTCVYRRRNQHLCPLDSIKGWILFHVMVSPPLYRFQAKIDSSTCSSMREASMVPTSSSVPVPVARRRWRPPLTFWQVPRKALATDSKPLALSHGLHSALQLCHTRAVMTTGAFMRSTGWVH